MNGVIMDKSSICRLCGTGEGIKFNIFDPIHDYISKIHQLLPVMVHLQDPWSKLICHRCAFKLQEFSDFREICVKTDIYLKKEDKLLVQQKWEQPTASSWAQPSTNTNTPPVRIKQEASDDPPPPVLAPQRPIVQQPPQIMQQPLMQQHSMMQQPYQPPVMQQQQPQLMPQQQYMSMLTQPVPHAPHLMIQRQPPTTPSPQQAPQLQLPMVQYNQKSVDNPVSKNVVTSSPQRAQSRPNAVFLNSGEGECFLPEGPDGAESDSSDDNRDMDSQGISDHDSNQKSSEPEKKSDSVKKRRRVSSPVTYKSRKKKSNAKLLSKVKVDNVKESKHTTKDQVIPRRRRGRLSKQVESQNKTTSRSQESQKTPNSSVKVNPDGKKKRGRKPGPKSKVVDKKSDCDSEISFLLYKPPNSILDTIDMTNQPGSLKDESNPAEGLPSHILLTKIPGICNIFTCTLCECTITSKKRAFEHECSKNDKFVQPRRISLESSYSNVSDGEAVNKEVEIEDMSTGLYKCDVCSMTFTRHVTLLAHKDGHLYTMNDSDSVDSIKALKMRKKKVVHLPGTEIQ